MKTPTTSQKTKMTWPLSPSWKILSTAWTWIDWVPKTTLPSIRLKCRGGLWTQKVSQRKIIQKTSSSTKAWGTRSTSTLFRNSMTVSPKCSRRQDKIPNRLSRVIRTNSPNCKVTSWGCWARNCNITQTRSLWSQTLLTIQKIWLILIFSKIWLRSWICKYCSKSSSTCSSSVTPSNHVTRWRWSRCLP